MGSNIDLDLEGEWKPPIPSSSTFYSSKKKRASNDPSYSSNIPADDDFNGRMESAAATEMLELTLYPTISRTELLTEDEADLPEQYKCTGMSIWTVTQLIGLVIGSAALISSLVIPKLAYQLFWGLNLYKWALLFLFIVSGCLLSRCFIHLFVFFFERSFYFRNQFLYFIYGVRRPLKRCMWFGLILLCWHFLLSAAMESKGLSIITHILIWAFVVSLLCVAKTAMLKLLRISFHLDKFFVKIYDALTNKHIVDRLLGPPNPMMQNLQSHKHGEVSIDQLGRLNKYNISAWYMARI